MNAKLFEADNRREIRLPNQVQFFSEVGKESREDFIKRVTNLVEENYMEELDLTLSTPIIVRQSSKQLLKKLEKAIGVEKELIIELLDRREVEIPSDLRSDGYTHKKFPEPTPELSNEDDGEEITFTQEELDELLKVNPGREFLKNMTPGEGYRRVLAARTNSGKTIRFKEWGTKRELVGEIKGARIDYRTNLIQYLIEVQDEDENGELFTFMRGKNIYNKDFEIQD